MIASSDLHYFYITPQSIERETPKAVMLTAFGWFPKSQLEWWAKGDICVLVMPAWLSKKQGMPFYTEGGDFLGSTLDEDTLIGAKEISEEVYKKDEQYEHQDPHPF